MQRTHVKNTHVTDGNGRTFKWINYYTYIQSQIITILLIKTPMYHCYHLYKLNTTAKSKKRTDLYFK